MNLLPNEKPLFATRFNAAMKEIRKNKIVARRNIATCCRGCYDPEVAETQPIIWHFGGQGNHVDVWEGGAVYRYATRNYEVDTMYFNHSNLVDASGLTAAGQTVVDVFKKHGIVIKWDQTNSDCIAVDVKLSLYPDYDYNTDPTLAFV